jgi:hypothetical protein
MPSLRLIVWFAKPSRLPRQEIRRLKRQALFVVMTNSTPKSRVGRPCSRQGRKCQFEVPLVILVTVKDEVNVIILAVNSLNLNG